jgi:hypothetical protein
MGCATEWSETLSVELPPHDAASIKCAAKPAVSAWEDEDDAWEEDDGRSMAANPRGPESEDADGEVDDDWDDDEDDDEDWDWGEDEDDWD